MSLLRLDGEYPKRRVLARNKPLWAEFKKDEHAFKGFNPHNTKMYLAMFVGNIVQIRDSKKNYYSNDMSLDGSASYLQYHGRQVPNPNGYLLDSAPASDPGPSTSPIKEMAATLGSAHLFQHKCLHPNCVLDTVSFTKTNGRNEVNETKLPVIYWGHNEREPEEGEELTINYSHHYVKPLETWLKDGFSADQLKPCDCQDCRQGDCTNYMPK